MLRLAEAWIAPHGDQARLFVGDAEAIDAPDRTYKAVVEYGILHHAPGWPQAMREIARVLKPGGLYFEDLLNGFTSLWPARMLFDHPQGTRFLGHEFRAGLVAAGQRVGMWVS